MVKNTIIVSSVLISVVMANYCFADTTNTLSQARQNIFALVDSGDFAGANTATSKLISDFNNSPGVDEAVHQIALRHQAARNYSKEIELSRYVVNNWPQSPHAVWAQMDIVKANLLLGNESSAQAEIETLATKYSDDPNFPWTLRNIGLEYRKEAFGWLLKKHFNSDSSAKIRLAVLDVDILAKIESGDFDVAGKAVNTMIAEFSSDTDLPEILLIIAQQFSWKHQYEQAGNVCRQIIQRYPTSTSVAKAQQCMTKAGQTNNIASALIDSADYGKVVSAVDELIAKFGDEADTPAAVYEIANRLEAMGQFAIARQVYGQIVWRYPKDSFADMSRIGVERTKVLAFEEIGDETSADSTFNNILNDFKDNSYLPSHVMWTAEGYYKMACKAREKGDVTLTKKLFDKTTTTLNVVLTQFSGSTEVPNALYLSAECHYQLNDYQVAADLFQKVADGYPKFQMAGNALYMVAQSNQNLKESGVISQSQSDTATKIAYEQLLQNYPNCNDAKLAENWLDQHNTK